MTETRALRTFPARTRMYVELLRGRDRAARSQALHEIEGKLNDDLAGELVRLLRQSRDADFRLQLLEHLARELDSGLYGGLYGEDGAGAAEAADGDDEEPELSAAAMNRLQESLRAFCRSEREPAHLRRKALEVAVLTPRPWQEEAVREAWASPEPEWQSTALFCMGHLFPIDFTEEINHGLSSPSDDLRIQAIAAAESRDLRLLGPRVLKIAADPASELEVRFCAIEALASLRPAGARALLEKLRGEPQPLCQFALDALNNLEQNARAEALIAAEAGLQPPALGARNFYEERPPLRAF